MSFYLTLPSNVTSEIHTNRQSNFTTHFKIPIRLSSEYEVALVEFTYREFIEVDLGQIHVKYENDTNFRPFNLIGYENEPRDHFIERINEEILNYYTKLESKEIENKFIDNSILTKSIHIDSNTKDEIKKKCPSLIKINNISVNILIPNNTTIKFTGHSNKLFSTGDLELKSHHEFQLYSELLNFYDYMFIYCDIIDYQLVGDQNDLKLLRSISKTSEYNKTIEKLFTSPHYVQVRNNCINSINIIITDTTGLPIKFGSETSKVLLKLHFKPKYG